MTAVLLFFLTIHVIFAGIVHVRITKASLAIALTPAVRVIAVNIGRRT